MDMQHCERCELGDSMAFSVHSNAQHVFCSTATLCITASLPSCHSIHWISFLASSDRKEGEMITGDVVMSMQALESLNVKC